MCQQIDWIVRNGHIRAVQKVDYRYVPDRDVDMVSSGTLSPELAIQVLVQFDKSMTEALESQVKSKVSVKGHLHTYRFCDNVWTFILQDALFKNEDSQENVGQVKIVACDSKLLTQ